MSWLDVFYLGAYYGWFRNLKINDFLEDDLS
jgi:hypothetical protein